MSPPHTLPPVGEVQLSGEQVKALAQWSSAGTAMAVVELRDQAPRWAHKWRQGDVFALQGDAHVHLAANGLIKDAVPSVDLTEPGDVSD